MPQTVTEKIVQAHAEGLAEGQEVRAGDMVIVRPSHVLTHDNTGAVMPKFTEAIGGTRVADPAQPVFALDHNVQDRSEANLAKYARIEAFAQKHGITFHPAGAGIGHQLMMEGGFVKPGGLAVASDSHSNMYGALAAVGTPVVRTDAAAIWATGTTWWQVPRTVRVHLEGELRQGVTGKDVILALCGVYNNEEVLNAAVEFGGPGVAGLSMEARMTISNMTTEWGALVGWFPYDEVTAQYMAQRHEALVQAGFADRVTAEDLARWEAAAPAPDADAVYAAEIQLDLAQVTPMVAGPHVVQKVVPLARVVAQGLTIHRAYLLSCVNGRLDDLAQAAAVLAGKKVASGVTLYVAAASAEVQRLAEEQGIWQTLADAGAELLAPGCGACIGLGAGLLEPGEVGISATNRNFKGRMGSRDARAFLASPVVVAASAVAGAVAHPQHHPWEDAMPQHRFTDLGWAPEPRQVAILDGFPERMSGRVLHLPADNLNTDGIYGKDVTYIDDLTPEQMAGHAMANYDPRFQQIVATGDIIVAGRNFGTGSSREQAATALKYRGVQMVIAASFSQTYLRNAFNNAFICLESPSLSAAVRQALASEAAGALTVPADELEVDFASSRITWRGQQYAASPMGPAAQDLILAGGLEALTRQKIGAGEQGTRN